MKKIISLLLAVLMAFSFVTVSFAEGETTEAPETETTAPVEGEGEGEETTDFGDLQWIMDLPFWTVKSGLKFAKVAIKLVAVYLKVAKIFGLVEQDMDDMILDAIGDLITKTENGETVEGEEVPETTGLVFA